MATATQNGHKTPTLTQLRRWIESIDQDAVTTGDAMEKFGMTRATARVRLLTLAEEGLLNRTGNGRGAKYHKVISDGGAKPAAKPPKAKAKPVRAASADELPEFLSRLSTDCDQELSRLDGEIEALEAARAELLDQEARLRTEREIVANAKAILA